MSRGDDPCQWALFLSPPHINLVLSLYSHNIVTTRHLQCCDRTRRKKIQTLRHGEVAVLREGAQEQGRLDQGGGPAARRLHQGPRRRLLAVAPQGGGPAALRQELPPPVDQLPPPRPQARQLHRGGRRTHHQVPRAPRKQVVSDRRAAAGSNGQRDQELLEHAHQAQAHRPRHRPQDAQTARCLHLRCRSKQPSPRPPVSAVQLLAGDQYWSLPQR